MTPPFLGPSLLLQNQEWHECTAIVLLAYCFDCFCMCSDDDVRGHECTTRCTSCRATLWAISTTCSLTELDRAVPHLHFISTSHPPVLGQVCYSQSSSCCAASIKWDQFCHEITLFPFAFDTPRGIWQVWVLQPKDKVVPFLQKWLHLYSCGEAFPGSRAFLQNTGELTWSQLNHAFDCLRVFSCAQVEFRVYVVFVAFSWGETEFIADAFLSVTSVCSTTVFSNYS